MFVWFAIKDLWSWHKLFTFTLKQAVNIPSHISISYDYIFFYASTREEKRSHIVQPNSSVHTIYTTLYVHTNIHLFYTHQVVSDNELRVFP